MKLVFIHSGEKVKRDDEGNLYTDGSYNMRLWERYLKLFDQITLLMRLDENRYSKDEAIKKFNIISSNRINFIPIPNENASIITYFNPLLKKRIKEIINREIEKSDAVIVRLPGLDKVIDYSNKKGKPCLVEIVGCPFDSLWNHSLKGKIIAIPSYFKLKNAMKKAQYAIYVTNSFLQKRYPMRGKQIGCSDVQLPLKHEEDNYFNKLIEESQKKDFFVLGTAAATNVKYKGQQYVIEAIYRLKKETGQRFIYQIAGNGDTSYLKSLVKKYDLGESVHFLGNIPHEKMSDWYRTLDIYIQPSKTEGLPRALVEAMSNGVACIGSNAGGIPELLDRDSIFRKERVNELKKLLLLFTDTELRLEKAKLCYQKSKMFESDILEQKRLDFMKEALLSKGKEKQ